MWPSSSRLRLGACAELWERPSQARDSPRLTLPSGPRRTPGASPPPPLLAAPPACAAAGKPPSPSPGWSPPRTPPSFPPFTYPRPWVTTSLQICPTPRSLRCFFSTPPPTRLPVWDSPSSETAPPSSPPPPPRPPLRAAPSLLTRLGLGLGRPSPPYPTAPSPSPPSSLT